MSGRIGLVGSGEFTAATAAVDLSLLEGVPARVIFLPTAAALEGPERVRYWVELGESHYRRLGVEASPLMVLDRATADSAKLAARVNGSGLIYLSGGDPTFLATTLVGSRVGAAIVEAWRSGASVAGCSAGAIALMDEVPDIRLRRDAVPGLGLVPGLRVIPHFDAIEQWMPGVVHQAIERTPAGVRLIGVDEDTGIVGRPDAWTVLGRGSAWVLSAQAEPRGFRDGELVSPSGPLAG
jgi:cyanophycinase